MIEINNRSDTPRQDDIASPDLRGGLNTAQDERAIIVPRSPFENRPAGQYPDYRSVTLEAWGIHNIFINDVVLWERYIESYRL